MAETVCSCATTMEQHQQRTISLFHELADAFQSVDWIIPAYIRLGALKEVADAIRAAAPPGKHAVLERELPLLYPADDLATMFLERYSKIKLVAGFRAMIGEALEAAHLGLFHVAVGALISVVEGVIRELADADGQPIGDGTCKLVGEIDGLIAHVQAWSVPDETLQQARWEQVTMLTVFRDFVRNKLLAKTSKYGGIGELNRHGILHGVFRQYGSASNFFKLVSFLDLLCFVITGRTGGSRLAPGRTKASDQLAAYYKSLSVVETYAVRAGARPRSE